jgi:hypothetical protein
LYTHTTRRAGSWDVLSGGISLSLVGRSRTWESALEMAQPKPWSSATPATNARLPLRLMGSDSPCEVSVAVARIDEAERVVVEVARSAVVRADPRRAARMVLGALAATAARGDALDDEPERVTRGTMVRMVALVVACMALEGTGE